MLLGLSFLKHNPVTVYWHKVHVIWEYKLFAFLPFEITELYFCNYLFKNLKYSFFMF